mmetsp:Transcript_15042/g.30702  ORF Transcript_15042/g.30702 Transcript_15042/m.30702 type:complete len:240 (-) Transcript_15042:204-923(-)
MNVINEIQRINALELEKNLTHTSASWHTKYEDSAWVYAGNLPLQLTEGDIICILSQFGEIEDINLVRDKDSGKSRGFAFVKYEDARSCVLAVDNFTGAEVLGRTLRVDHVERYRLPKHLQEREGGERENEGVQEEEGGGESSKGEKKEKSARLVGEAGHAYEGQELASSYNIHSGLDLFAPPPRLDERKENSEIGVIVHDKEKEKEEKRLRKEARAKKRREKEEHRRRKEERKRRKWDR